MTKLDLASMNSMVAADYTAWSSTKLRFDRIDGPSSGDVQFDHLVGIFATRCVIMLVSILLDSNPR